MSESSADSSLNHPPQALNHMCVQTNGKDHFMLAGTHAICRSKLKGKICISCSLPDSGERSPKGSQPHLSLCATRNPAEVGILSRWSGQGCGSSMGNCYCQFHPDI